MMMPGCGARSPAYRADADAWGKQGDMRHRVGAGLRASLGLAACAAVVVGLIAPSAAVATDGEAAPSSYSDVRLEWGINSVYPESPSPGGTGCSFFSAGTQLEFAAESGDVRIVKRAEDGSSVPVTKNSICLGKPGTELGQRMQFNGGSGQIDPVAGTGTLRWSGAVTANGYGGMVPWWIQDPALTFSGDGTAVLTAHRRRVRPRRWRTPRRCRRSAPGPSRSRRSRTWSLGPIPLSLTPRRFGGVDYFKLSDPADPSLPTGDTVDREQGKTRVGLLAGKLRGLPLRDRARELLAFFGQRR